VFLWPVKLDQQRTRRNEWNTSALAAAEMAMTRWVRITSNMSLGAYEVFTAEGARDQPEWPDVPFKELLVIAFKHRLITTMDHEVLRRLRGEA
jgi:hypothetical protein